MEEIWKPVVGYEGLYEVSNLGRFKSLHYGKERILKPMIKNKGYETVLLCKKGVCTKKSVHREVLLTFVGKPKEGEECDHIDRNPKNNRVDNLRWVSRKENMLNTAGYGTSKFKGVFIQKTKRVDDSIKESIVANIRINNKQNYLGTFNTEEEAHEAYKQAFKKHYGYEWI